MTKKKMLKVIGITIMVIVIMGTTGFVIWANDARGPMDEASQYLQTSEMITVLDKDDSIEFIPDNYSKALIFYPGGKVDEVSYAPLAYMIAEQGFLVIIAKMPLYLAVFDINAAEEIMNDHNEVTTWTIGGHSLGGSMAANYVYNNLDKVSNLALFGSYPASSNNFTELEVNVLSIYGTEDGGFEDIELYHNLLPEKAEYMIINGGNHAQFGYYGIQDGDGSAIISREYQHEIAVNATVNFLNLILP